MPRQTDHGARREALCAAVCEIARRDGFHAVTVRAVSAALGASTSAVTHYYASRDDLVGAAVRRELDAFRETVAAAVAGRHGTDALLALVTAAVVTAPGEARGLWLGIVEGARRDAVLRRELAGFNAFWDARVARHAAEAAPDPVRRAALVDAVDVVTSGLVSLSFEDEEWDEPRRRALVAGLLGPLLAR